MRRLAALVLACLLVGCASDGAPRQSGGCIPGDPAGPPACQAKAYLLAF